MPASRTTRWWARLGSVAIACGAIASLLAGAAAPGEAGEREAAATTPVEALLVGDSVMNGMAQSYGAPARQLLAARHTFVLDTAGCRRLITTSCRIGDSPAPTNAITVVRARAGQYARALVVGAGYNDPTTGSYGIGNAVDTLVAEARAQGVEHVVWLTYREAGPSASRFRAHNGVLRAKLAVHPELLLADWAGRSASMPASWFSSDGIHLGADAAKGMADLIADTLDLLPPDNPCRVVDTTVAPAPPAAPPSTAGGLDVAAAAPEPARRLNLHCR